MNFAEAFISLTPQLGASATASVAKTGATLGTTVGKAIGDGINKGIDKGINDGFNGVGTSAAKAGGTAGGSFSDTFKKRVEAALKTLPDATIGAATGPAEQKIRDLAGQLKTLSSQQIGIDIDSASALAEITAVKGELESLARESPDVQIKFDVGLALGELKAFEAEVAKVDGKNINVKVDVDTKAASAGLGQLNNETKAFGSAVAALGPVIVPVAAAAIGLGIGAGAAIGAAGAALGLFGAAVASTFSEVKKQQEKIDTLKMKLVDLNTEIAKQKALGADTTKLEKERIKVLDQINKIYENMTPGIRNVADSYEKLKGTWQGFIQANGPAVYGTMVKVMDTLGVSIGKLQPLFDIGAAAAGRLADKFATWTATGGVDRLVATLTHSAGPAIENLGTIAKNVGIFLINMFKGFEPAGQGFLKFLADGSAKLAAWSSGNGLTKFIDYFKANGPGVGTVLIDIAGSLAKLVQATAPLAPITLAIAKGLSALIDAVPVPVLTTIIGLFVAYNTALVAYNAVVAISVAVSKAGAAATVVWSAAQRAAAIATNIVAVAQWAWNAALTANPIGIIVVAIAAFVAAIVLLYNKNEAFRKLVQTVWTAIKVAISAVSDWFVKNVWPGLKTTLDAIGTGMTFLWKNVIVPVWNGISAAVRVAWDVIKAIFTAAKPVLDAYGAYYTFLWKNIIVPAWEGMKLVISAAWTVIKAIFTGAKATIDAYGALFTFLWKNIVVPVWEGIKATITTSWNVVVGIFNAAKVVINAFGAAFTFLWKNIIDPAWKGIQLVIQVAQKMIEVTFGIIKVAIAALGLAFTAFWKSTIVPVWEGIKTAINTAWLAIQAIFNAIIAYLKSTFAAGWNWLWKNLIVPVWTGIKTFISTTWAGILTIFNTIMAFLRTTFAAAWNWLWHNLIVPVWTGIKTFINTTWLGIQVIFNTIMAFLRTTFAAAWNWLWHSLIQPVWTGIKTVISTTWAGIQAIFNTIIAFLKGPFMAAWNAFKTGVETVWNALKNALSAGWNAIKNSVFDPLVNFITKSIPNAFNSGVNAVKAAWDKIQNIVKAPVKFVVETVINGGIIKGFNAVASKVGVEQISPVSLGFADGGVLPGYTPGRDVHHFAGPAGRLSLSGGEAIMRPEFTRAVGTGFVDTMNAAARTGGVNAVRGAMGFANGGVMKFAGGGVVGKAKSTLSSFVESISDPAGSIRGFVSGLLGKIPGRGIVTDIGRKAVEKLMGGVTSWISNKIGSLASSLGSAVGIGQVSTPGTGWQWIESVLKKQFGGGVSFFSTTGGRHAAGSWHYRGKAVDLTPSMGIFNWIKANYGKSTKELIYGPAGTGIRNGSPHNFGSTLNSQHMNHIHWAIKKGGVFKYDNGGWLNSGSTAINQTGRPEAVLTPDESRGLKNMSVGELAELLRELIDAVHSVAPGVGGYIRGSGKSLVTRARSV